MAATGWLCAHDVHHAYGVQSAAEHEDETATHSNSGVTDQDDQSSRDESVHVFDAGQCSACSACCFSAAVVHSRSIAVDSAPARQKVYVNVASAVLSRAG